MKTPRTYAAVSLFLIFFLRGGPSHAQEKPNVLLLMSDQHRADGMGWINPSYRTPNLDRLAAAGLRFTNCYSVSPLCAPSRAALMTGLHPHQTGVFTNRHSLPAESVTVAEVFRDNGYQTAFFGKWHLGGLLADHGFQTGRQGILLDQQDAITTEAAHYLRTRDVSKPFFLMVSWIWPHPPRRLVTRYADEFPLAGIPVPFSFRDTLEDKPLWYRTKIPRLPDRYTARLVGRQYRTMVRQVDAWIGRLLHLLQELGLAENTIVAYTSDHGELLGAHRLTSKMAAFEESVKVPLLLHLPPALALIPARRQLEDLVSNSSIPGTLLELAGLQVPASFGGGSLVAAITRAAPPADEAVFFQYRKPSWGVFYRGVRTRTGKYVDQTGFTDELYDLALDPLEMINRVGEPSYTGIRDDLAARVNVWWLGTSRTSGTAP